MKWYGLTGGVASGKSSVAKILRELGEPVVDADELARQVVQKGTPGLNEIQQVFGPQVLTASGELDRAALGRIVFQNPELRKKLEGILHPAIRLKAEEQRLRLENEGFTRAFYDVPLLFEAKIKDRFDAAIVVSAEEEQQLERMMKRDALSLEEAQARITSQLPMSEKIKQADFVIENHGSLSDLKLAVQALLKELDAHQPQE